MLLPGSRHRFLGSLGRCGIAVLLALQKSRSPGFSILWPLKYYASNKESYPTNRSGSSAKLQEQSMCEQVRVVMRKVPHPVMVILARDKDDLSIGLLVSSFNTVTLYPDPVVSFNIKLPSSTFDAIKASGAFKVFPITSVETAQAFMRGQWANNRRRKANLVNATRDEDLISNAPFEMSCEWLEQKSIAIGDHVVMLGRVLDVEDSGMSRKSSQLIYSEGRYRNAGEPLMDQPTHKL